MVGVDLLNDGRDSPTSTFLFPLPSERAIQNVPGQGWKTATTVKGSNIPGAGNGRYENLILMF